MVELNEKIGIHALIIPTESKIFSSTDRIVNMINNTLYFAQNFMKSGIQLLLKNVLLLCKQKSYAISLSVISLIHLKIFWYLIRLCSRQ